MNHRQANAHYRRQIGMLEPALLAAEATLEASETALASAEDEDTWEIDRLTRANFAYADSAHSLRVALAEARVNVAGSSSRLGGQKRAQPEHEALMPSLQSSLGRAESWRSRVCERGLTLPEEREGVDIALLADAELRDIYRALDDDRLDDDEARAKIAAVASRFDIEVQDLSSWRNSQGFPSV